MTRAELEYRLQDFWHLMTQKDPQLDLVSVHVFNRENLLVSTYQYPCWTMLFPKDFAVCYRLSPERAITMFQETLAAVQWFNGILVHRPNLHRVLAQSLEATDDGS